MWRNLQWVAGFLSILVCAGCSTPQVTPSGFLSDYSSLRFHKGLSLYYADPITTSVAKTHVVILRDVQWRVSAEENEGIDPEWREELCRVFKERLYIRLLQEIQGSVFVLKDESLAGPYRAVKGLGVMTVDSAITGTRKGLGLSRYMVGFGLGDAKVTVEAQVVHTVDAKEEIYRMVVFARSAGNPHSGLNPRCFSALYTLRVACDSAARKTAKHLAGRLAKPDEKWWKRIKAPVRH